MVRFGRACVRARAELREPLADEHADAFERQLEGSGVDCPHHADMPP